MIVTWTFCLIKYQDFSFLKLECREPSLSKYSRQVLDREDWIQTVWLNTLSDWAKKSVTQGNSTFLHFCGLVTGRSENKLNEPSCGQEVAHIHEDSVSPGFSLSIKSYQMEYSHFEKIFVFKFFYVCSWALQKLTDTIQVTSLFFILALKLV